MVLDLWTKYTLYNKLRINCVTMSTTTKTDNDHTATTIVNTNKKRKVVVEVKAHTALEERDTRSGAFQRIDAAFRNTIQVNDPYPPTTPLCLPMWLCIGTTGVRYSPRGIICKFVFGYTGIENETTKY